MSIIEPLIPCRLFNHELNSHTIQFEIEKKQRDIHVSYLAIPIDGAILGSSSDCLWFGSTCIRIEDGYVRKRVKMFFVEISCCRRMMGLGLITSTQPSKPYPPESH